MCHHFNKSLNTLDLNFIKKKKNSEIYIDIYIYFLYLHKKFLYIFSKLMPPDFSVKLFSNKNNNNNLKKKIIHKKI